MKPTMKHLLLAITVLVVAGSSLGTTVGLFADEALQGSVRGTDNQPIGGASVIATPVNPSPQGPELFGTVTNTQGNFTLPDVPAGLYEVKIKQGDGYRSQIIRVGDGGDARTPIRFDGFNPAPVQVVARLSEGASVSDFATALRSSNDTRLMGARIQGASGRATVVSGEGGQRTVSRYGPDGGFIDQRPAAVGDSMTNTETFFAPRGPRQSEPLPLQFPARDVQDVSLNTPQPPNRPSVDAPPLVPDPLDQIPPVQLPTFGDGSAEGVDQLPPVTPPTFGDNPGLDVEGEAYYQPGAPAASVDQQSRPMGVDATYVHPKPETSVGFGEIGQPQSFLPNTPPIPWYMLPNTDERIGRIGNERVSVRVSRGTDSDTITIRDAKGKIIFEGTRPHCPQRNDVLIEGPLGTSLPALQDAVGQLPGVQNVEVNPERLQQS